VIIIKLKREIIKCKTMPIARIQGEKKACREGNVGEIEE
jgi:hypothetical protein